MRHTIEVEHDGVIFDVSFRAVKERGGTLIEDVTIEGVDDPSDELDAAAEKAAGEWIEGALDYERSGW